MKKGGKEKEGRKGQKKRKNKIKAERNPPPKNRERY